MGRGPNTGPYTIRCVRVLLGGGSDTHDDLTTFPKYARAIEAAERRAADFFDDGDFAVTVFVIDRDGVAVHRARGNARQADSGPEIRRIL